MSTPLELAFACLPEDLRNELIKEFRDIQTSYFSRHWSPAELSGGRFCEVVYSIIDGHEDSNYPTSASKPRNFLAACQSLENKTALPRSFRILIPRLLPAIYEIRNNRGVGHIGGDVDPNYMDSTLVLSSVSWIMAELIRVLHNVTLDQANELVSQLSSHNAPAVWVSSNARRVLNPKLKLKDKVILLVGSLDRAATITELIDWTETTPTYIKRLAKNLHKERLVEYSNDSEVVLLPPGLKYLEELLLKESESR